MDPADFVLQDINGEEKHLFDESLQRAVAAIETWLSEGVEDAMSRHNQPPPENG
jgi:peptidyl-tRNA hydrolase